MADNNFNLGIGVEVITNDKKIQSQINQKVKDTKIKAAIEINADTKKLKAEILKVKNEVNKKFDIQINDKTAIQSIKNTQKAYAQLRKEMYQSIGTKSPELTSMASYYTDLTRSSKNFQLAEIEAYKTNDAINNKKLSNINKVKLAEIEAYKTNSKLNDNMSITSNRAKAASSNFNSYAQSLKSRAFKEYSSDINNISKSFEKAQQSGKSIDLSKANSQLSEFKGKMKDAGLETASFTQVIKNNIGAFTNWYLIGGAVSGLIGNFKEAIGTIIEVDTQLTEISKTSNLAGDDLKKLGIDAFDAASKYGTTVQSYLSGFLEMSRGTDEKTAKGLAEISILAQSAGDMTAELANSYIVATNAAYELGNNVSDLNAILDGQNQITNRNQVSMSDLAEATKVAGSQASQSGIEVDKMTAATGTMIATTKQGGEIAGRAFKGILMNLMQVSGEMDGEVFDVDSFKKAEAALNDVGVATEVIVDGTAKLRDPMETLKELASVYNSLPSDSVQKANIINDLGGKVYHVMQKCITRTYLIAGNALEPCTTI